MRRAAVCLALCAAALLGSSGVAQAALKMSATGNAPFPERAFVLTLPEHMRLTAEQVSLAENGAPVDGLRVAPVGAKRRANLGVVLAIDSSRSMEGAAYQSALDAARAFADERNRTQPLAIVTFGTDSRVLQPFTTIDEEIHNAIASAGEPAGGTHMYDAAIQSIQLVRKSGLRGGFVVVLSDGTDHGSAASGDDVVAAAQAAHVRVYTVGLRSAAFDPEALNALAAAASGEYSEATSIDQLQGIYRALGAELSNAHLLTYRSLARPGRKVDVRATIAGVGTATASYTAPKLQLAGIKHGKADDGSAWDSTGMRAVVVALVAALLASALTLVLRSRERTPTERVTQYVVASSDAEPDETLTLTERLGAGAERSLSKTGSWEKLATALSIAGIKRSAGEVAVMTAIAAVSLGFLAASISTSAGIGLLAIMLVVLGMWIWIRARIRAERRRFADQLADHLSVVGGSLRVGHSLTGALTSALDEAADPARREFTRAVADERLGMPLEDALQDVAIRMDNREIEHVALLAKLQREAGADAGEMVDQVVATVRERQELRRAVRTLTAQGRLSQYVLTVLPIGSLLFLTITYGDYVDPLYHTSGGHVVLAIAAVLLLAGALIIRRIVSFRV